MISPQELLGPLSAGLLAKCDAVLSYALRSRLLIFMQRLLFVALLILSGCTGTRFQVSQFNHLRPGMTAWEVRSLMPSPTQTRQYEPGIETWFWTYTMLPGGELCAVALTNGIVSSNPTKIKIEPKDSKYERYHERRLYLLSHPDLRPDLREELASGMISIAGIKRKLEREEQDRMERARADQLAAEKEQAILDRQFAAEKERRAQAERAEDERINTINKLHVSDITREAMVQHKILIGMTADQVKLSWGDPPHKTRSVSDSGTSEIWLYSNTTLSFSNGLLVSFTESQ